MKIVVNPDDLKKLASSFSAEADRMASIDHRLRSLVAGLDWETRQKTNVDKMLGALGKESWKLINTSEVLSNYLSEKAVKFKEIDNASFSIINKGVVYLNAVYSFPLMTIQEFMGALGSSHKGDQNFTPPYLMCNLKNLVQKNSLNIKHISMASFAIFPNISRGHAKLFIDWLFSVATKFLPFPVKEIIQLEKWFIEHPYDVEIIKENRKITRQLEEDLKNKDVNEALDNYFKNRERLEKLDRLKQEYENN